jgi:hypothetical protein
MTANGGFARLNGLAVEWGGFRRKLTDIGEQFEEVRKCEEPDSMVVLRGERDQWNRERLEL